MRYYLQTIDSSNKNELALDIVFKILLKAFSRIILKMQFQ